jgi:hypothetical protein
MPHAAHSNVHRSGNPPNRCVRRTSFIGWAQRWHRRDAGEVSLAIIATRSFFVLKGRLSAASQVDKSASTKKGEPRGAVNNPGDLSAM